ncbi:MAG: class II fructose-bisphosphate aldolase family protein [Candidatus Colwellbacteria bacterium]|nr:class II fructose-bisphosphate aldolase family protein [Candidatus Colwellbacteria bacterium]
MKSLREVITDAESKRIAVGHFNVSDITAFKAITEAARELNVPVIIGTSEGEAEFIGFKQAAALVGSLREEGRSVFLNADHFRSLENVKRAVEAGYDSIIFDAAHLLLEENVEKTKEATDYVKSVSASRRTDILVEGELGYIGTSSKVLEKMPEGVAITAETMTKPEEAKRFVEETGVDMLAPAVGNIHGIVKEGEPRLDIGRIAAIKQAINIPLVLHGGSGVSDDDFRAAIAAGISVIHINTEIRIDWREGLQEALEKSPEETTPYKLLPEAEKEIYETVLARLKLFNNLA